MRWSAGVRLHEGEHALAQFGRLVVLQPERELRFELLASRHHRENVVLGDAGLVGDDDVGAADDGQTAGHGFEHAVDTLAESTADEGDAAHAVEIGETPVRLIKQHRLPPREGPL